MSQTLSSHRKPTRQWWVAAKDPETMGLIAAMAKDRGKKSLVTEGRMVNVWLLTQKQLQSLLEDYRDQGRCGELLIRTRLGRAGKVLRVCEVDFKNGTFVAFVTRRRKFELSMN
jgi:hypothetical protein